MKNRSNGYLITFSFHNFYIPPFHHINLREYFGSVLQSLSRVRRLDLLTPRKVCDRTSQLEHAVISFGQAGIKPALPTTAHAAPLRYFESFPIYSGDLRKTSRSIL